MVDYDSNSSAQQSIIACHDAEIRKLVKRIGRAEPEFRIDSEIVVLGTPNLVPPS